MKTLKEYTEILYKNGYKESFAPYTFLDNNLEIVEFMKNDYRVNLYVAETEEFSDYLASLSPGTEYQIEYENYYVKSAFIESPICNVSNFIDGSTDGIELVSEANEYNKHTLELFEQCLNFQKTNLLEHELFIMSCRQEHLMWAQENLIPILEKYNFYADYDSFFDTKTDKCSSHIRIDFKHPNRTDFVIETDCITGKPIIWVDMNSRNGCIDLTDKIYGKKQDDVFNILLEEVWKKDELRFGYIYNNDPQETIDTYKEVLTLIDCLHYNEKKDIDFTIIPKRYNKLIEDYNQMLMKL